MFRVIWDREINGILLTSNGNGEALTVPPRPVYFEELDLLGFDKFWSYPRSSEPLLWACDRRYFYNGKLVAEALGGNIFDSPLINVLEPGRKLILTPIQLEQIVERNNKSLFILEQEAIEFIEQTYRTYSYKNFKKGERQDDEVDYALLAEKHEKNTKIKHVVVKEDCDSFDVIPLDLAKKQNKTVYLNTRIDLFIASFSGGKDSQVTLDLVSRVIPPDGFLVLYSDTGMELPPSLEIWEKTQKYYNNLYPQLKFHLSKNSQNTTENLWDEFGLPSRIHRWCCTVAKTAPLYHDLKKIYGNGKQPNVLVFEGVRSEESPTRAKYDRKIGKNVKHHGVINASPIYYWNTSEVFLYLFLRKLEINHGYRIGLNRVGCVICPFSSEWSEHIVNKTYKQTLDPFLNSIKTQIIASGVRDVDEYIKTGKWKSRAGGQALKNQISRVDFTEKNNEFRAVITNPQENLLEWLKVLGPMSYTKNENKISGEIKFKEVISKFTMEIIETEKSPIVFAIFTNLYNYPNLIGKVKKVLYKTTYCTHCLSCEIECPTGALTVQPKVNVSTQKCTHCWNCIDFIDKGCMMAKSLNITEGGKNMKRSQGSLNKYEGFGIKENWLSQFFQNIQNYFEIDNNLGGNPQIRAFTNWLKDAEIIGHSVHEIKDLGYSLQKLYSISCEKAWEIMWINFNYNSLIVKWYTETVPFNAHYSKDDLESLIQNSYPDLQPRTRNNALSSLLYLFKYSNLPKIKVGSNEKKGTLTYISKQPHEDISTLAVAYSLYRYSQYKNRFNFRVSEFYEQDQKMGIYREFGLTKEKFQNLLRTLQENKNGIVQVDLVMGLDNISLREDLTYQEVIKLILEI